MHASSHSPCRHAHAQLVVAFALLVHQKTEYLCA